MSFLSMLQMAKGKDPPPQKPGKPSDRPLRTSLEGRPPSQTKAQASPLGGRLYDSAEPKEHPIRARRPVAISAPTDTNSRSSLQRQNPAPAIGRPPWLAGDQKIPPMAASRTPATEASTGRASPAVKRTNDAQTQAASGGVTKKRLSFKDVMKQAATIDKTKLEVNLRVASKQQQQQQQQQHQDQHQDQQQQTQQQQSRPRHQLSSAKVTPRPVAKVATGASKSSSSARPKGIERSSLSSRNGSLYGSSKLGPPPKQTSQSRLRANLSAAAPFAKPSPELQERLKYKQKLREARSRRNIDLGEDLDDFVVSEDEEGEYEQDPGEVWELFNRKPKSAYMLDDSDDDMEARGSDILEEERRSAAQARREDQEEERRLEELARQKRLRKGAA